MRKHTLSVLAAAAVGLTASMASAADLPRKAPAYVPPVAPPPITWTGCYIGGNVGGVFTRQEADFNVGSISHDNSGFTGGGQIGCDYQWAGGWVIGFRNMFNGTSGGGKTVTLNGFQDRAFDNATVNFSNQWFDALTARLGYAWGPAWLMYFQGGAVWSKAKAEITGFGGTFNNVALTYVVYLTLPVTLAQPPGPEQAGRLVVALNGGSRRSGRRFWKVITTTTATTIGP